MGAWDTCTVPKWARATASVERNARKERLTSIVSSILVTLDPSVREPFRARCGPATGNAEPNTLMLRVGSWIAVPLGTTQRQPWLILPPPLFFRTPPFSWPLWWPLLSRSKTLLSSVSRREHGGDPSIRI